MNRSYNWLRNTCRRRRRAHDDTNRRHWQKPRQVVIAQGAHAEVGGGMRSMIETELVYLGHHSHDLEPNGFVTDSLSPVPQGNAFANRIFAREIARGRHTVDDNDVCPCRFVLLGQISTLQ